jgi:hypothetical protein
MKTCYLCHLVVGDDVVYVEFPKFDTFLPRTEPIHTSCLIKAEKLLNSYRPNTSRQKEEQTNAS